MKFVFGFTTTDGQIEHVNLPIDTSVKVMVMLVGAVGAVQVS